MRVTDEMICAAWNALDVALAGRLDGTEYAYGDHTPMKHALEQVFALSHAAGQEVEVRKGCGDPECGCDKPTFTEPMEAIRFLAGRLEFAGVSDAVAKSYALDLRNILRTHPAVARSEGEES